MKQKINNLISLFRKHQLLSLTLLFIAVIFGWPAHADLVGAVMSVLAVIFDMLSSVVGKLLTFLLQILVNTAQFNDFIYVEPVVYGWVVVRDICNMFFIVILLIIAFATILQLDGYNWKKDVPKLVIAAILINFSKMFAGLMIDVSQVIMLTFVNAFAANGANNFAVAFQVSKYKSLSDSTVTNATFDGKSFPFSLLLASIASFAAVCITTVIVVVMIAAFVMRIVLLWIYVILSPLPYLLSTFPQGKKYAGKWSDGFTKELVAGPVLAFFTWLALTVAQMPNDTFTKVANIEDPSFLRVENTYNAVLSGGTELFTNGPFQKYLIVIGLLVGGLKIAGETGGTFGDWAKKGTGWVNKGANWAKKTTSRKLQDVTGISAVREYGKMVMSNRADIRKNKIEGQAHRIAGGIGAVQNTVGGFVKDNLNYMRDSNRFTRNWGIHGRQAESLRKKAAANSETLKQLQEGEGGAAYELRVDDRLEALRRVGSGPGKIASVNGKNFTWDAAADSWVDVATGSRTNDDDIKKNIRNDASFQGSISRVESNLRAQIKNDNADAEIHQRTHDFRSKITKFGAGALSLAGVASGNPILAAIGGTIIGGSLAIDEAKDLAKFNNKTISKYNLDKGNKAKGDLKEDDDSAVLKNLNDVSKSVHDRFGAFLEAIDRKLLSEEDVVKYKADVSKALGGLNAQGNFNDSKLQSRVSSLIDKNYKGLKNDFHNAYEPGIAASTADRAKKSVQQGYAEGDFKLKDLGLASLTKSINELANGMKTGEFVKQYKELGAGKQREITTALKAAAAAGNENAMQKLAEITDATTAFGAGMSDQKARWVKGKKTKDITDTLENGTPAQETALIQAIQEAIMANGGSIAPTGGSGGGSGLSINLMNNLNDGSVKTKALRIRLGIEHTNKL